MSFYCSLHALVPLRLIPGSVYCLFPCTVSFKISPDHFANSSPLLDARLHIHMEPTSEAVCTTTSNAPRPIFHPVLQRENSSNVTFLLRPVTGSEEQISPPSPAQVARNGNSRGDCKAFWLDIKVTTIMAYMLHRKDDGSSNTKTNKAQYLTMSLDPSTSYGGFRITTSLSKGPVLTVAQRSSSKSDASVKVTPSFTGEEARQRHRKQQQRRHRRSATETDNQTADSQDSGDEGNECRPTRSIDDGSLFLFTNEVQISVKRDNITHIYYLDQNLVLHRCKPNSCTNYPLSHPVQINPKTPGHIAYFHDYRQMLEQKASGAGNTIAESVGCRPVRYRHFRNCAVHPEHDQDTLTMVTLRNVHASSCKCTLS